MWFWIRVFDNVLEKLSGKVIMNGFTDACSDKYIVTYIDRDDEFELLLFEPSQQTSR